MPLSLGKIIFLKEKGGMRESFPRGRHLHFEQMFLALVMDYDIGEPLSQTKLISLVNSCHSILSLLFQDNHHIQHIYYLCSPLDYKERSPKKHKSLLKHW